MTPKEKAEELFYKFYETVTFFDETKKCALIAVDEVISANPHSNPFNTDVYSTMDYWQEVKKEIENFK
jgi:hypothetical protein